MDVDKKLSLVKKQKESLISQVVEKLKIMGFANVTTDNILTDEIYHLYFLNFLNNISNTKSNDEIIAINELKMLIIKLFEL